MSLQRNVAANFLASGWAALMGLAFVPLYVRYLGIESYALIGFFATLQVWLALLDLGFNATINREMARFSAGSQSAQQVRDLLRSMEVICTVVALLLAVLVAAGARPIGTHWLNAQALPLETVVGAIALMGLVIASQWLGTFYRSGLLGLQRQLWLSGTAAVAATVRALGSVAVLAYVSPTLTAFFLFQAAVSTAEAIAGRWYLLRALPRAPAASRFDASALRRVWRFAAALSMGAVLATLLTQLDKVLLARLLPLDQFGYFMLMVTVAGALSILTVPVHNIAYPRFAALLVGGDEATFAVEYHRFAQLMAVTVLPAGLMLAFFSSDIVYLWTGDEAATRAVAPLLSVWVAGTTLNALMHVPYMAQLAHGWTRLSLAVNAAAVALMLPALLVLVPRHGAIAAAWIWLAINAAYVIVTIPLMHRRILRLEQWRWYGQDVLAPLAAGALATIAMKALLPGAIGLAQVLAAALAVTLATGFATPLVRQLTAHHVAQLLRR